MIVFDNVVLRYPYDEVDVLKGVSFTLQQGLNTVLADAQSGKSSICKLLVKDVSATSGQIFVDGQPISSITNSNLDILYLPSNPTFFERRSVQYNLEYPLIVRKIRKDERHKRAISVAQQFGLDVGVKARSLTVAQRRTLALARGLTVTRKVVLFDGFFDSCLDNGAPDFQYINSVLQQFDMERTTCVILTSNKAIAMGNTVVLDGGKVVFCGDAAAAQQQVDSLHWLVNVIKE